MVGLVENLRKSARLKGFAPFLDPVLKLRKIHSVEYVNDFDSDGAIHPLGHKYEQGFKMMVKRNCSSHRIRFTIAHEICHTMFYEMVPEVKFKPHEVDPKEERLCNIGAAALLVPARILKREVRGLPISFDSLEQLSKLFNVSLEVMLLRLRSTEIWHAELSVWRLMTSGKFLQDRLIGGRKVDWTWCESDLLRNAWATQRILRGRTYLACKGQDGGLKIRAVSYELKRRGDTVLALWSHPSTRRTRPAMPLFEGVHHSKTNNQNSL